MSGSGYGDQLSPEELIARHELLAYKIANERLAHSMPGEIEDAVQEARIALWEVAQRKPEASQKYLNGVVKYRVATHARYPAYVTGAASVQGKQQMRPGEAHTLDDPDNPVFLTDASDALDKVLLAYHEGEILQAIGALPDLHKRYIVMRFWGGMTNVEIAAQLDMNIRKIDELWRSARPKLREALEHLSA